MTYKKQRVALARRQRDRQQTHLGVDVELELCALENDLFDTVGRDDAVYANLVGLTDAMGTGKGE